MPFYGDFTDIPYLKGHATATGLGISAAAAVAASAAAAAAARAAAAAAFPHLPILWLLLGVSSSLGKSLGRFLETNVYAETNEQQQQQQ